MKPPQINENEVELRAIRAGGPGGQHVNKVASAIQLRFDIAGSRLPEELKARLLKIKDRRITAEGIIVITARQFRNQEANRIAALERLNRLLQKAGETPKKRKATRPTRASVTRRLDKKTKQSQKKKLRGRVDQNND